MNWAAIAFDWNHIRAFLATAEEGSLSAAARVLNQTQPTLGRQVAALEEELNVVLFERTGRTLILTQVGRDLLEHVRAMGEAASHVSLVAAGQSQTVEGKVSITATDIMSAWILPPVLKELREIAPGIELEIVAANDIRDLQKREADIALRHVRPEQPELIAKRIGTVEGYMYACPEYISEHGPFRKAEDLQKAEFLAVDTADDMIAFMAQNGVEILPSQVKVAATSGIAYWQYIRAGMGVGMMDKMVADRTGGVVQLMPDVLRFDGPIWLTTHRELHTNRRIRIVFDHLAKAFAAF